MAELPDLQVVENRERRRFEIRQGRKVLGWSSYDTTAEVVIFTHTEVSPRWEGHGLGSLLVRTTLDAIRADGMKVVPQCSLVRDWIVRHPEYADLVFQRSDARPSSWRPPIVD